MRIFAQSPMIVKATRSVADIITAVTAGTYEDFASGSTATATLTVSPSGSWSIDGINIGNFAFGAWINNSGNAGNYSVRWTNTAGTLSTGTAGTWLALTATRNFQVTKSQAGTKSCTGTVDFALTSNTSVILATSSVTIKATNDGGGGGQAL